MGGTQSALPRTVVAIFGEVNAGKSTLFNLILGQTAALVSEIAGTTTDPVSKNIELLPYGPVTLIDTAGLGDGSALGNQRQELTNNVLRRAEYAVYAADCAAFDEGRYRAAAKLFDEKNLAHLLVFTKKDMASEREIRRLSNKFPRALFISCRDENAQMAVRARLGSELKRTQEAGQSVIKKLLKGGKTALLVCPIDAAAPKGRLILPQVQTIRDCLDNGVACVVVRETELERALGQCEKVDLVITDSQVFEYVDKIVPPQIPMTSFSMLLASRFGSIETFIGGAKALDKLKGGERILFAEACTHNVTHDDIGRVKIPALIEKRTGKKFAYEYAVAYDFPRELSEYALIIHCGGCMVNRRELQNRVLLAQKANVPITNYGVLIAHLTGVLERSAKVFGGMD